MPQCSLKEGGHSVLILKPNGTQSKQDGGTNCREEASPVISDSKVCGCYFNTEEDTCQQKVNGKYTQLQRIFTFSLE